MYAIRIFIETLYIVVALFSDIFIFTKISRSIKTAVDKAIVVVFLVITFFTYLIVLVANSNFLNIVMQIEEALLLYLYFGVIRKNNKRIVIGSIVAFYVIDMISLYLQILAEAVVRALSIQLMLEITGIVINLIVVYIVSKFSKKIRMLFLDKNSSIFFGVVIYLFISGEILVYFLMEDKNQSEIILASIGILILQTIFLIIIYISLIRTQKNLLTKQEQKQQKLELQIAKADKQATEARNKNLLLKQQQLTAENQQLKEYSEYLDKNEDELRRFKHDYQNILNSLKVSAQEGKVQEVVDKLDKYSQTQFDQKALRKYKGVNHVHVEDLKSIAIAKLAKVYNANIDYTFGCEHDVTRVPTGIDLIDLSRIIGITFDNAVEESLALIESTGKHDSAKIEAMYYQDDDTFEFLIRNRTARLNTKTKQLSRKGYTTKKEHSGLGLANVGEIAAKYPNNLLIDYRIRHGWFVFKLTAVPDGEHKEE